MSDSAPTDEEQDAPALAGRQLAVGDPPSARAVRRELRARRREHSDRTFFQAFEELYLWVVAVLMVTSMGGVALRRLLSDLGACATGCAEARDTLAAPLAVAVLALALRVLIAVGPLVTSRASADWLLATPVDRGALMRRPMTALVIGGPVVGAVVAGAALTLAIAPASAVWPVAAAGGAFTLAAIAAATLAQAAGRSQRLLLLCCDAALALALAAIPLYLLGVSLPAVDWNLLGEPAFGPVPLGPVPLGLAIAGLVFAAALPLTLLAYRRLGRLHRRDLVAGGGLLAGVAGAAAALDTSLLSDLLTGRRFRRLGARPSRRGRGRGLIAIAGREMLRWLRSPQRIVIAAGLLVVPYVAARLELPSAVALAAAIAGYVALRPFGGGLHVVARSAGLRRALPQSDVPLRLAWSVPTLLLTTLWCLGTVPAMRAAGALDSEVVAPGAMALGAVSPEAGAMAVLAPWSALALAVGAGVLRSVTRKPVSFEGPLISTPAGALPAGFVSQLFRGPDVLLTGVAPLALGWWWPAAVILPLILLVFVLSRG